MGDLHREHSFPGARADRGDCAARDESVRRPGRRVADGPPPRVAHHAGRALGPPMSTSPGATASRSRSQSAAEPPAASEMTWRLHAEMVLLAGWGRAILLQLAHPLVA